jgi:hypothetical protein
MNLYRVIVKDGDIISCVSYNNDMSVYRSILEIGGIVYVSPVCSDMDGEFIIDMDFVRNSIHVRRLVVYLRNVKIDMINEVI